MLDAHNKVSAIHLERLAYLYIRQSSLKQIMENTESTKRQYALKERAIALGWSIDRIIVIDDDLGQSGAQAVDREGFQKLVAEVGLGNAGIIMGLEVSRLARNSIDWHRLLEICALSNTLILDEDGVYNPIHFNDRLLLGLKGTMSEAELHMLRLRLRGGALNKAKRGELKTLLPIGFVYDADGNVVMHPDKQVQDSIYMIFKLFQETGSARSAVKLFHKRGFKFPRQQGKVYGSEKEILWGSLSRSQAIRILKSPRYAGIYCYGRVHRSKSATGKQIYKNVPKEQWHANLVDSHVAYISQQEYEKNIAQLLQNAQLYGGDRKKGPPREGPALLQGIAVCGMCGRRMGVRYKTRCNKILYPIYVCQHPEIKSLEGRCQFISGAGIDKAIGELLIESMTPHMLEVALNVQEQLLSRLAEADELRKKVVERALYEAELAKRRYMHTDPQNRLVASTLEAEWNEKLKSVDKAQEEYERQRIVDAQILTTEQKEQIMALSSDFPRLWNDCNTPDREKKRMVRMIIEDVTITRNEQILIGIRFKGGATKTLIVPISINKFKESKTKSEIIEEINNLLEEHYDIEIANIFNSRGILAKNDLSFTEFTVRRIRNTYKLKSHYTRLREKGMLDRKEMKIFLNISDKALRSLKDAGIIKTHLYGNGVSTFLYEPPNNHLSDEIRRSNIVLNKAAGLVSIQKFLGGVV